MTANQNPAANWYADPTDPTKLRYWDGSAWTEHTAPGPSGVQSSTAPLAAQAASSGADRRVPEPPHRARGGLFGSKKGLEAELEELRSFVDGFGYEERAALTDELARLRSERDALAAQAVAMRSEATMLAAQLVRTREELILQEVGVYDYHHRLEDSTAYKAQLDSLRKRIREMSKKDGGAVQGTTNWTVDGSAAKGRKMVNEISKLLLRAYNGEADVPGQQDAALQAGCRGRPSQQGPGHHRAARTDHEHRNNGAVSSPAVGGVTPSPRTS
jgi:cell division protein FtsB